MSVLDLKEKTKIQSKRVASVDSNRCAACGECVHMCPRSAAAIQDGCYAIIDNEKCVGCGLCEKNCPVGCIHIIERGQVNINEK